MGMGKQ